MLRHVVDETASILDTPRVSLRLLAESDELLATCRAGQPVHASDVDGEGAVFARGEGLVGWVAETGEVLRTGRAEDDARFAQRPGQLMRIGSFVGVPLFDRDEVIGVLAAVDAEYDHFTARDAQLLEVVAALCAPKLCMARLERMARRDALTSLLNRHGLRKTMRSRQVGSIPLSVVLVDLDHFKLVNDRHGHAAGDAVLTAAAGALKEAVRAGDVVARYGGEEFLFLLPHASAAAALIVAERARAAVAALQVPLPDGGTLGVTLSAGVARRHPGEPPEAAIARADRALYQAKARGRDQVRVAPGDLQE